MSFPKADSLQSLVIAGFLVLSPGLASADKVALDVILAGMDDNKFVAHNTEINRDMIALGIGPHQYMFFAGQSDSGEKVCTIVKKDKQEKITFSDTKCDGLPDGKIIMDGEFTRQLSDNDRAHYSALLKEYAPFVAIMKQYKKFNPDPGFNIFRLTPMIADNNEILKNILRLMEQTSATEVEDGNTQIHFIGSNNRSLHHDVDDDGQYYTVCKIHERSAPDDILTFYDKNCNGGLDYFSKDGKTLKRADPVGTAEVYKSMLMDLERFVKAAAHAFPR